MKKCPFCSEEIHDEAIKCKHCKEFIKKKADSPSPICKACGGKMKQCLGSPSSKFCVDCGAGTIKAKIQQPPPRHSVGGLSKSSSLSKSSKVESNVVKFDYRYAGFWDRLNVQIVCPHCNKRGAVTTKSVSEKKGISGAKATGALLTGGISLWITGLSQKISKTQATCHNCSSSWTY